MTCKVPKIKTDFYLPEEDEISNLGIDQTVLIKEDFLKFISQYRKSHAKVEFGDSSLLEDWYAYVNSYYPYTEDVDAFARVNHLLGSRPSFASLSSADSQSQNDGLQDKIPYSEAAAQLRYLESTPFSFLILGKPEIGQQELGRRLADHWQCIYIDPQVIIEQEIASGSRAGQCIEFNLKSGRAIGIDVILRLVEKRVRSESAKHRGFVISGMPLIPNDLYQEDPISSESAVFTVKEIFEEMFETLMEAMPPSKPRVSVSSKYKSEEEGEFAGEEEMREEKGEELEEEEVELSTGRKPAKFIPFEIPVDVGPDYDVCHAPRIGTNYEDQLNFIFDLMQRSFMIIYVMCSSTDVIEKRKSYRFDVHSKQTINLQTELYNSLLYRYISGEERIREEIPEDMLETEYINHDTTQLNYLVRLPRHFPANVSTQLDSYHYTGLNFIERRILMHDPQYFLKVDGRTTVQRMLHIIKSRLKVLPIQQVISPIRLNAEPLEIGEDGPQESEAEDANFGSWFRNFSTKQLPCTAYKWNWSDWGVRCPVALKDGILKNGDPQYVVHFMNKLFFLASEDNFFKFYRNPRPYLLPPCPKPTCKIFVFGPKYSGKTAVSRCLGYLLNGTVLCIADMLATYLFNQEEELKEKIRQAAIAEAMKILNEQRAEEAKILENERIEKIKEWAASTKRLIEDLMAILVEMSKDQTVTSFEISSFPMAMKKVSVVETETPLAIEFIRLKEQILNLRIPFSYKIEDWQAMLTEKRKLLVYMPVHLRSKVVTKPATIFDEFVVEYARIAVENADMKNASISNKSLANIIINQIKAIEDERIEQGNARGGWILDGMLCDVVLIEELYPDFIADEVIVLLDEEDSNFLVNRYRIEGETDFEDYHDFFMSIGKVDAAWRSPFKIPKKNNMPKIVREILSDIIDDPNAFDYGDSGPTDKVAGYHQEVLNFNQKWDEAKKYFLDRNIVPIEVKVTDKYVEDLMKDVISGIEDRYRVRASLFTELDRAEEVKNFGSQMMQKDVSEGDNVNEDAFEKNRRYGNTYHYCPVTFHDQWVMWKGKEDYAVKFENKLYLLSSEEDMNNFLRFPRKYLTEDPPEAFPPPRICVVGVPGTGKTTVAKALAKNYGLTYVSYESVIKKSFRVTTTQSLNSLRRNENIDPNLFAYLSLDLPLEEDSVKDNMCKFWFEPPVRGFVIDDFPKRPSDVKLMTTHKMIPDIVINLTSNTGKVKSILIKKHLGRWEIEMNEKRLLIEEESKVVRLEWEEIRKKRFDELMEEKREQRYALKRKNREESAEESVTPRSLEDIKEEQEPDRSTFATVSQVSSQVSFDSVAEQEDIKEVSQLLDAELPEPMFEDTLETVDDATERFDTFAVDTVSVETGFLKNIRGLCSAEEILFTDVPVDFDNLELTIRNAFVVADKFKFRTRSHFERCYDLSVEDANKLLSCGYFFLSKFGKYCPVQYYEDKNPVQMYIPMEQKQNLFPVIHRTYIYYIVGKENQIKFKEDPLKYTSVESFQSPLITFKVAVSGPPKCGKTLLASRIADEFGFKLITRGQAARYVLTYLPFSDLAKSMESVLRQGWELTDEMVVKSVEAATFDGKAVTQGIVFDGFPNSITEVLHLSYTALVPNIAIDLQATTSEIFECLSLDTGRRGLPRFNDRFVEHLLIEWKSSSEMFREWFDREYQVLVNIPISSSSWFVWDQTWKYITAVFFEIKHYFVHIVEDWAVRLANMQITPLEFLERQGAFKTYCPSCLHFSNTLTNGGDPPDRTGLVQYRQHFYWVCPAHIEDFLVNPDTFMVPYNNNNLPQMLPEVAHLSKIPENVFEDGICVVCYKKNRVYVKGDIKFAVEYSNRTYLFDSKYCFREFSRSPQKYMCEINFKPPENYPPLNYEDLPVIGMLEQYVANDVTKALSSVARRRPVIPGLDIQTSALIGVGLYLKIFNPKVDQRYKSLYKEADDLYHKRRTKLINYLDRMKSVINPYLHYEEPLPEFESPVSVRSESTESAGTTATKIIHEIINNIDYM